MNFSGKHFEFAGTSSKDPLGDGSVSLIFAHIDTEMFKQPFGYPEYSSVYSGRLGRRGLTGTKRNDSCLEIEAEIVSEKGGIPLASLRVVEQWLFSREAFAKLYVAEDEEDPEDVQYINGEKKRLYLNCMLTEPEILTYSEGKVGWKLKIICDAPWAWQDEHTQTAYRGTFDGMLGWYCPAGLDGKSLDPSITYFVRVGNAFVEVSDPVSPEDLPACNFTLPEDLPQRETRDAPYMDMEYNSTEYTSAGDYIIPAGASVSLFAAAPVNSPGYAYIEIDGEEVASTEGGIEVEYLFTVPDNIAYSVTSATKFVGEEYYPSYGLVLTTTAISLPFYVFRAKQGAEVITVTVNSDINDYIYPESVDVRFASETEIDDTFVMYNNTDDPYAERATSFRLPSSVSRIYITNLGTVSTAKTGGDNLLPYMTARNFPRLVSSYVNNQIELNGHNTFACSGEIIPNSIAFTFRNRRFLS